MDMNIPELQVDALAEIPAGELDIRNLTQTQLMQLGMAQVAYDGWRDRVRHLCR